MARLRDDGVEEVSIGASLGEATSAWRRKRPFSIPKWLSGLKGFNISLRDLLVPVVGVFEVFWADSGPSWPRFDFCGEGVTGIIAALTLQGPKIGLRIPFNSGRSWAFIEFLILTSLVLSAHELSSWPNLPQKLHNRPNFS